MFSTAVKVPLDILAFTAFAYAIVVGRIYAYSGGDLMGGVDATVAIAQLIDLISHDPIFPMMLVVMLLDVIAGNAAAIRRKDWRATALLDILVTKLVWICAVLFCYVLQRMFDNIGSVGTVAAVSAIGREGYSIIRNAMVFGFQVPESIRLVVDQIDKATISTKEKAARSEHTIETVERAAQSGEIPEYVPDKIKTMKDKEKNG